MGKEDDYATVAVLGRGGFGVVKKVRCVTDNKFYACKIIHFREGEISLTEADREYATLKRLHHPHIVEYIDYRWQLNKAKLYMEYCSGGDLRHFICDSERLQRPISESQVWCVLSQIACALLYCHYGVHTTPDGKTPPSMPMHEWDPIIHRDIKPANILINTNASNDIVVVKLGDFGLSRIVDTDTMPASYAGTRQYQPPDQEIARANPHGIRWTKKCDIFSLGCTLYEMCTWKAPFSWRMEESDVFEEMPSTYSERLRRCIASCLAFHSEERYDAFDLLRLVQRTRTDPATRHLILTVPDPPHEAAHRKTKPQIPPSTDVEAWHMPGAFETRMAVPFDEAAKTIRPQVTKTSDQPNPNTVIRHHQPSEPTTVVNVPNGSNPPYPTRPGTEPNPRETPPQNPHMYHARCPLCGLKFLTPKASAFSQGVQEHFESTHTKKHGKHLCAIDGCRFSKGAGLYSVTALFDHSKADHAWQVAECVSPADPKLRLRGAATHPIGELRPDPEKCYCPVLDCPYSTERFVGFVDKDSCLNHMYSKHKNGEIAASEMKRAGEELVYEEWDPRYIALLSKHKLQKEKRQKEEMSRLEEETWRKILGEPKWRGTKQQRDEEIRSQIQAFDDMPEKPHVLAIDGKFYCADSKCPYSVDQFVGFYTSEAGRMHQQTHPGWTNYRRSGNEEQNAAKQNVPVGVAPNSSDKPSRNLYSNSAPDSNFKPGEYYDRSTGFRSRLRGAFVNLLEWSVKE